MCGDDKGTLKGSLSVGAVLFSNFVLGSNLNDDIFIYELQMQALNCGACGSCLTRS